MLEQQRPISNGGVQPLLSLIMIVRNEQDTIEKTLSSALPHVNCFTILDTGSTDSTRETISRLSDGYETPGRVLEEPFVDFATTRNRCIEYADHEAVFFLTLDSNDELVGGSALIDWCKQFRDEKEPQYHSFLMKVHWDHDVFSMQRLFRSDANCRYVGSVHECLQTEIAPEITIDRAHIFHSRSHDENKSKERWLRDCRILEAELEKNPGDSRSLFYLAQSYVSIGRYVDGFRLYSARADLRGPDEETFHALYRRAELADRFLDFQWHHVEQFYLDAHRHSPKRAEPLVRVGAHFAKTGDHRTAYRYLHLACALPLPENSRMCVDLELYNYGRWDLLGSVAYFNGRFNEGIRAVKTALGFPGLPPGVRAQLELNLRVYQNR